VAVRGPQSSPVEVAAVAADRPRLYALGYLRAIRAGESSPISRADWGSRKARLLLACLLAEDLEGHGLTRDTLCEAVWAASDAFDLENAFHVTLTRLRKAIAGDAGEGGRCLLFEDGRYRLDFQAVWCDARHFEVEWRRSRTLARDGDRPGAARARRRAFDLYDGELLADLDEPWIEPRRERLRSHFVELGRQLAGAALEAGRFDDAEEVAARLVACDPLAEEGHQLLIRAHLAAGRRDAARRQLERCRSIFATELGEEPSAATLGLLSPATTPPSRPRSRSHAPRPT
jgi:DNA-binding SARP family transcriptional activator